MIQCRALIELMRFAKLLRDLKAATEAKRRADLLLVGRSKF
jgi:hypothetical protein